MTTINNGLLKDYPEVDTTKDGKLALREIVQSLVLIGLSRGGFFKKASFYGGTALRIFYGLSRFSEDLDFTLNEYDKDFSLEPYLPFVEETFASYGIKMNAEIVQKKNDSPVESAFAKVNTYQTFLVLQFSTNAFSLLHKDEVMKVKFEVDKDPALGFEIESKWLTKPEVSPIVVLDGPSLFAGKIHAILCRNYKNTVKGRDYYDFLFYISNGISPNLAYLRNKLINTGKIEEDDPFNLDIVKKMLIEQVMHVDFQEVVKDVSRFLSRPENLSVYCQDLFVDQIAKIR